MSINTNDHTATLDAVLETTTAIDSGTVPAPTIGDNSAIGSDPLPDAATIQLMFHSAYDTLTRADIAVDVARMRIAHLILMRHEVSFGANEPTLFQLALESSKVWQASGTSGHITSGGKVGAYFDALTDEFVGENTFANSNKRKAFRIRILRAFKLALAVAFNGGTYKSFDHDTGRLRVVPAHFAPFGYMAMGSLTHHYNDDGTQGDKIEFRTIGDDTGTLEFSVSLMHGADKPIRINTSIAQYVHATQTRIDHYRDPSLPPAEATPAKATKAAKAQRAPTPAGSDNRDTANKLETDASMLQASADAKAKEAIADTAKATALIAKAKEIEMTEAQDIASMSQTELGIAPSETTAQNDLLQFEADVNRALTTVGKLFDNPQIKLIKWARLSKGAQDALVNGVVIFETLKATDQLPDLIVEQIDAITNALEALKDAA